MTTCSRPPSPSKVCRARHDSQSRPGRSILCHRRGGPWSRACARRCGSRRTPNAGWAQRRAARSRAAAGAPCARRRPRGRTDTRRRPRASCRRAGAHTGVACSDGRPRGSTQRTPEGGGARRSARRTGARSRPSPRARPPTRLRRGPLRRAPCHPAGGAGLRREPGSCAPRRSWLSRASAGGVLGALRAAVELPRGGLCCPPSRPCPGGLQAGPPAPAVDPLPPASAPPASGRPWPRCPPAIRSRAEGTRSPAARRRSRPDARCARGEAATSGVLAPRVLLRLAESPACSPAEELAVVPRGRPAGAYRCPDEPPSSP